MPSTDVPDRAAQPAAGPFAAGQPVGWPSGWRLIALDTVDSTNRHARDLAAEGAAHGTVVTARRQDDEWFLGAMTDEFGRAIDVPLVADLDTDDYRAMQETNVDGVFYATRAALPHLVESQGNLVFVGSFAGQYPRPFNPVYAATKWWTRGFALSVAGQVGDDGVGVTVVNPAAVRTEFTIDGLVDERFEDRYDPGEAVEPGEVADAIAFAVHTDPSTVTELDLYDRGKLTMF